MAAAENEVAAAPERFVRTYFDPWGLAEQLASGSRFLILGPKGAGKSAAARYIELQLRSRLGDHAVFADFVDFDELNRTQTPLTSLDRKLVGDVPALVDSAWRVFLGVRLLQSLARDPACELARDMKLQRLLGDLEDAGLASTDYPQVLRRVRERRGTIGVPGWVQGERGSTEVDQISPEQLGEALLRLVASSRTECRHLLVIDGLDKAIGDNEAYWDTLAALVRVGDAFHRSLRLADASHVMLIILCRSDVFRRARFADAAKVAADGACHLDWGAEDAEADSVLLWDYLARKAEIEKDELFAFLPDSITVGKRLSRGRRRPINTKRYVLDFTRYTPRDMTLLFNAMQGACGKGASPTDREIRRGADVFATHHLVLELESEAHGLLPDPVSHSLEKVIAALPLRVFRADDLENAMKEAGVDGSITATALGEYLFLQGAIGNYLAEAEYIQFYHRRDTHSFQRRGPWVLHNALVYAFNIPWARPPQVGPDRRRRS
jgi:AAA ATPase domain